MRLGLQAENGRNNQETLATTGIFGIDGVAVTTRQMLAHPTIGGAKALGLDGVTGSLEAGKAADVILVRHDQLHHRPLLYPFASIVLQSRPSDVDTVLVDGVVRKRGGQLDAAHAAEAGRLVDAAWARVGAQIEQRGGRKPRGPTASWRRSSRAPRATSRTGHAHDAHELRAPRARAAAPRRQVRPGPGQAT